MKETRNLVAVDKHKLYAFLISSPLQKPQLQKLYKIDVEKGYDLTDTKCIDLAFATMTREQKIYLIARMVPEYNEDNKEEEIDKFTPYDAFAIKLMYTLKYNRDVKITASEHKELLEKIPLKKLPPLPINVSSRIYALAYQL